VLTELITGLLMPLSLVLKFLTPETPSLLTMPALKERTLLNLLKDAGSMDFGSKVLLGTSPRDTLKTLRVKISSSPSLTLRFTPNAPLSNRRDLEPPRKPLSMTRTCTLAPYTSTPCVKTDTSSPSSTSNPSPHRIRPVRREKVLFVTRTPW